MRERSLRAAFLVLLSFLLVPSSVFSASLVKLTDWRDLSDREVSAAGREALQIHRDLWKHAETEHFVYHFRDVKEAETVYVHAEAYYGWVKDMFGVREEPSKAKCHVYIFEDKVSWDEFNKQKSGERLPGAEAYTNGTELFIYREPFYLAPQRVLAHEITHIVAHRFIQGTLPLYLNEGLAEFMSYKAIAQQSDGNEYDLRTIRLIPPEKFIPVSRLEGIKNYPAAEAEKEAFYQESELFARYLLLNHDSRKFYALLERAASGEGLETSLKEIYGADLETVDRKFRIYAVISSQK